MKEEQLLHEEWEVWVGASFQQREPQVRGPGTAKLPGLAGARAASQLGGGGWLCRSRGTSQSVTSGCGTVSVEGRCE